MTLPEFWKLNAICYISPENADLRIYMTLQEVKQARICKDQLYQIEGERNENILHYEEMFGNFSERRESKCCGLLTKHRCKVKVNKVLLSKWLSI